MTRQHGRHCGAESPREPVADDQQVVPLMPSDWWIGLAVALAAFVGYVAKLAPGLLRADVGEFQTLAVTLGYAHPTGYPVYLLLAKLATLIPIGAVPYRVNLLSAIMGAVAVGVLYLLGRLLTGRRWVPVAGALALAVSPTFWSQAIIAEVYTPAAVCMIAVLFWLGLWQQTGRLRRLFAGACLGGVSLGVHSTVALMAPAAMLFVLLHPQRWKANVAAAMGGAAAGEALTLAAFAVIDSADGPCSYFNVVINPSRSEWNLQPEDTDDFLERVMLSMSAPQFRGMLFSQTPQRTRQKTIQYLRNLPREFPPAWLIAAVAGLFWLSRRNWKMALLLTLTFFAHLFFDLHFDGIVHLKYIFMYIVIAVFGVAGLAWLSDAVGELAARYGKRRYTPAACDRAVAILGVIAVLLPMTFPRAWNEEGRRKCWVPPEEDPPRVEYSARFHQDVRELIGKLEDDAVVFTGWCVIYPYYYVAHVEQGRTGIVILHDYPTANHFELADSALEYVKHVKQVTPDRPIYFTHVVRKVADVFELEPAHTGLENLYRVGQPIEPQKPSAQ